MSRITLIALAVLLGPSARAADPAKRFVYPGPDSRLVYDADARGNRIPDFSCAGYAGGAAIPDVPVRVVVPPAPGDNADRIHAAIDHVSKLPSGADGFRGAVLLLAGRYEVGGQLRIGGSGVVLRGQGKGTVLVATGTDRRALIQVRGTADRITEERGRSVADAYVPLGASTLRLDSADGLK